MPWTIACPVIQVPVNSILTCFSRFKLVFSEPVLAEFEDEVTLQSMWMSLNKPCTMQLYLPFTAKWSLINFIHVSTLLQVSWRRLPESFLIAKWPWWFWINQRKTSAQGRRSMSCFWSNRPSKLARLETRTFPVIEGWVSEGVCAWSVSICVSKSWPTYPQEGLFTTLRDRCASLAGTKSGWELIRAVVLSEKGLR